MRTGFTGAGIDRADHLRLDPERIAQLRSSAEARVLRLGNADLDGDGRIGWAEAGAVAEAELIFLGLAGDTPLFTAMEPLEPAQRDPRALFGLIERMHPDDAAIWGTALSLLQWHERHRFCGNCGTATFPFRAGWGRRCDGCGSEHYPRVDPVVIMLAEHDGRVLVGRQYRYPPGRYSALAGFVEPGESIEEAVARELQEEAGIAVGEVSYVASQPWPFPGSLMIGCHAMAQSDRLMLDSTEIEHAFWADASMVAAALAGDPQAPFGAPPPFAIAHSLLARWLGGRA